MTGLTLYYHPFASYCQKTLVALYENGTAFDRVEIDLADEADRAVLESVWPMMRFPVLRDAARGVTLPESTIIIEYVARHYPGAFEPIPADPDAAFEARLMDRLFDGFVQTPMAQVVFDRIRPEGVNKDPYGVEQARAMLSTAYAMLDERLAGRTWAAGEAFSLADCAACPQLFYSDWVQPFDEYRNLRAYYERLRERPSFARVVEEARPYRAFFPSVESDRISD